MTNHLNKVLVINYVFPPLAGSGVIRTQKFVKNLPTNNWFPIVLTLNVRYGEKLDYTLLDEMPKEMLIFRTNMFDINDIYRILGRNNAKAYENSTFRTGSSSPRALITSILRVLKEIFHILFMTPDKYIGWFLPGILKGFLIINKEKVKMIFSSSPSPTAHLIALCLKKITNKAWVADFRDPWYKHYDSSRLRLKIENYLESLVVNNCDKLIANTESLKSIFIEKFGNRIRKKIEVIPNGFDPHDFDSMSIKIRKNDDVFVISHVGEFYEDLRTPDRFLNCVSNLIKNDRVEKDRIRINFVGSGDYVVSKKFADTLNIYGLDSVVNLIGHVSHSKSIEYMMASDLLLLLQPSNKFRLQIPAKAFEYIRARKHILAITPLDSATSEFVRKAGHYVVDPFDLDLTEQVILSVYDKFIKKDLFDPVNLSVERTYNRVLLTSQLARIFNELNGISQ